MVGLDSLTPDDLHRAWAIARDSADQDFSLTDYTSYAVIARLGLRRAFSLDSDYSVFRNGPRRTVALDVLGLERS